MLNSSKEEKALLIFGMIRSDIVITLHTRKAGAHQVGKTYFGATVQIYDPSN